VKKVYQILMVFLCLLGSQASAQSTDSLTLYVQQLPAKYYSKVNNKISSVDAQLSRKSIKYLAKFQKQEAKLQRTMQKLHPELMIDSAKEKYNALCQKLKNRASSFGGDLEEATGGEYNSYLDSLVTSLSFLKQFNGISDKVKQPLTTFNQLQDKIQESEKLKAFFAERKSRIKEMLSKYTNLPPGVKNRYDKLNKTTYYFSAQIREYKEVLKEPEKIETKVLGMLGQLPAFQKFMKENSQLGGLFVIPSNYSSEQALQGLQTLDQVRNLITGRIGSGSGATQALQSQMQAAQESLNKLKDKLSQLGGGSGDIEMPDFKPENYKTKPFLKRLEYGTNMQTTRGSYGFPTTTDIGLSVGYKLKNKLTAGLGISYKQGWGKDIQHINFTSEGVGFRSFFDYQLKKNFYATGGFEYNYQQPFKLSSLTRYNAWQQSGLIGITKTLNLKSKVFKKTKVQILWDFMSYSQPIKTKPLKFRVGYNF
jgi:hypothetical protein